MLIRKYSIRKKGQAALEFLVTYGWAFLVILLMIGGLSYFGVLSPTTFLPDKCIATTGFSCDEVYIDAQTASGPFPLNSVFRVDIVNNLGTSINFVTNGHGYLQNVADAVVSESAGCQGLAQIHITPKGQPFSDETGVFVRDDIGDTFEEEGFDNSFGQGYEWRQNEILSFGFFCVADTFLQRGERPAVSVRIPYREVGANQNYVKTMEIDASASVR